MIKATPLSVVFDLDGTLISEDSDHEGVILRPGAIKLLKEIRSEGLTLAIWTAASEGWCAEVKELLCKTVSGDHGHACSNSCELVFKRTKWGKHLTSQGHPTMVSFSCLSLRSLQQNKLVY